MTQKTIFKWPIVKFSKAASREISDLVLNSKSFKLEGTEATFYLRFEPIGKREDTKNYCGIYLIPKSLSGLSYINVYAKFWIENDAGQMIKNKTRRTLMTLKKVEKGLGIPQFVSHDELYSNKLIKNDFIFICCEVEHFVAKPPMLESERALRKRQYSLYKSGITDNCTIQLDSGDEFKVAKNVLMAESNVFYSMFTSEMQERQTNVVKIRDVSPKIMSAFIDYLHLHHLNGLNSVAQELFKVADLYMVKDLMNDCVESMSKTFNKSNILERLEMAFMHSNENLKNFALDYVTDKQNDGNFRQILKTEKWEALRSSNSKLAQEIMDAVFDKTNWLG